MRLVALILALLSIAVPEAAWTQDLPAVAARGTLRVIFAADTLAEAISLDPGRPPGLEREMIEGFAALHRLKVQFLSVPTGNDQIPALLAGKGDMIAGAFGITEQRRREIDFTVEVFPSRHVVVTRQPQARIDSVEDLRRVRVGTMRGSSWAATIEAVRVPPENVDDSFETAGAVLQGLRAGKVQAIVIASGWALLEIRKDPKLQLGTFLGAPVGRAWGVRKDAPELRQALDQYVTNVRRTSSWNRLVVKYYGELAIEVLKKARVEP